MKQELLIGAGCFWGVQNYYDQIKGIINTEVGYANGPKTEVTYEEVCKGIGHVEVTKVIFDDSKLSLEELFNSYIRIINPFLLNQQGNDKGVQYRIGLYTNNELLLSDLKKILDDWELNNGKSTIEIKKIDSYFKAETYHQNYLIKNPLGYCHINLNDIPKEMKK